MKEETTPKGVLFSNIFMSAPLLTLTLYLGVLTPMAANPALVDPAMATPPPQSGGASDGLPRWPLWYLGLTLLCDLQHVVPPAQTEWSPVQHEVNVGKVFNRPAPELNILQQKL